MLGESLLLAPPPPPLARKKNDKQIVGVVALRP